MWLAILCDEKKDKEEMVETVRSRQGGVLQREGKATKVSGVDYQVFFHKT